MIRNFRYFASIAIISLVAATPAMAEPRSSETPRSDGSTIHWALDIRDHDETTALIVIAQGSGCAPAMQSQNLQAAHSAFRNFAALTVEKYGVQPGDNPRDDHTDCSHAFRGIIRFPSASRIIARS